MTNLVTAWKTAQTTLKAAGVDQPSIDARLMLEAAAGATRMDILTDPYRELTPEQQATFDDYIGQRARRRPVSHILGRKGFWKIMLSVTPDVLTPRPDTESILDVVLPAFPESMAFQMLDLGVGSGAIMLAILAERPAAKGLGIDTSSEALAVAKENAANLDLNNRAAFLRGDWTAANSSTWWSPTRPTSPRPTSTRSIRRCATMSRDWRWTAGRTGWTPTACWPRRSCGCSSPEACSPWRSAMTSRRPSRPCSRRPARAR